MRHIRSWAASVFPFSVCPSCPNSLRSGSAITERLMRRYQQLFFTTALLLTVLAAGSLRVLAQVVQPDRIVSQIDSGQMVALKGNVYPKAQPQSDQGPVEPTFKMGYITLLLKPTAKQKADLKKLLAEQQDQTSPNYHNWLSPEQYADRFGLNQRHHQDYDLVAVPRFCRGAGCTRPRLGRVQRHCGAGAEHVSNRDPPLQRGWREAHC